MTSVRPLLYALSLLPRAGGLQLSRAINHGPKLFQLVAVLQAYYVADVQSGFSRRGGARPKRLSLPHTQHVLHAGSSGAKTGWRGCGMCTPTPHHNTRAQPLGSSKTRRLRGRPLKTTGSQSGSQIALHTVILTASGDDDRPRCNRRLSCTVWPSGAAP